MCRRAGTCCCTGPPGLTPREAADAATNWPVPVLLRPGKTPSGNEIRDSRMVAVLYPSVWLKAYPAKEAGAGRATGPDDVAHADRGCRTPREHWGSVDVSIRRRRRRQGADRTARPFEGQGVQVWRLRRRSCALSTCCAICCQALQTRSESDFHPPGSSAWSNRKPFPVTATCEGSRPERE